VRSQFPSVPVAMTPMMVVMVMAMPVPPPMMVVVMAIVTPAVVVVMAMMSPMVVVVVTPPAPMNLLDGVSLLRSSPYASERWRSGCCLRHRCSTEESQCCDRY
jgi:hypothetical protein